MLAGLPSPNCWTIAEHAAKRRPRGMQRLIRAPQPRQVLQSRFYGGFPFMSGE